MHALPQSEICFPLLVLQIKVFFVSVGLTADILDENLVIRPICWFYVKS